MTEKLYNIFKLLICFMFFMVIGKVVGLFFSIFNITELSIKMKTIIQCICSLLILILVISIYFSKFKNDYLEFKKDLKKNIMNIIKIFFIFMIIKYLIGIITSIIVFICGFDITSISSNNQDLANEYIKVSPILMFISAVLLGPIYEEGIFRLGMKKVIYNKWLFIIISGALFGLMHIFPLSDGTTLALGIIQSISYVTMGIFFSFTYYKNDNIYITIGVHFLNNLLSVLAIMTLPF